MLCPLLLGWRNTSIYIVGTLEYRSPCFVIDQLNNHQIWSFKCCKYLADWIISGQRINVWQMKELERSVPKTVLTRTLIIIMPTNTVIKTFNWALGPVWWRAMVDSHKWWLIGPFSRSWGSRGQYGCESLSTNGQNMVQGDDKRSDWMLESIRYPLIPNNFIQSSNLMNIPTRKRENLRFSAYVLNLQLRTFQLIVFD